MNPYWDCNFFEFFATLVSRIFQFLSGDPMAVASDEVQLGTLALVALSCGLIGPFLVLKRMTMFANSLSHTILLGIVFAFLFTSKFWGGELFSLSTLLIGSFLAALLTAFFTEGLVRIFRLPEDASVGLVFSVLFALGISLVTLFTRDVHLSTEAIMGNADTLQPADFYFASLLAVLNISLILVFFRQLQISAFDRQYASTLGIRASFFHFLLLFLSAAVCVGAFRAVGVLLVLAFLTGPYLTARLFSHRLSHLLWLCAAIGVISSFFGVALARHLLSAFGWALSTGGIVVCIIGLCYGLSTLFYRFFCVRGTVASCERGLPF